MKTVVIAVSLGAYLVLAVVASFHGLDLRKRSSWLYGTISFLGGLAGGFALSGSLIEGLKSGAIFAFLILFTGVTMRWHKQRYEGKQ